MALALRPVTSQGPGPTPKYYPIYFAPDLDPAWMTNPGILTDVADLVPSRRGTLKTYASTDSQDTGYGTFTESTYGVSLIGGIFKSNDGSARLIVGTPTRLMENTTTAWVDRSAGSTAYATAAAWCFTTYGNELFAVSKANAVQMSTAGAFAALSGGPPKASCCTTNKNFVILGDCNDGTNDLGDQVWWSALANPMSWTPSAATQAGNLQITDTPGKVTALVNIRDCVAVYKEDSLHVLEYQNQTLLWTPRLISDKVGCAALHGVAVVAGMHYFLHRTGVYRFDGASIQPVGYGINKYLFDKMGSQVNYATAQAVYDEYDGLILWYFHDSGAGTNERRYALAFNPYTNQFGFVKLAWFSGTGTCRAVIKCTLSDLAAWNASEATQSGNVLTIGLETTNEVVRRPIYGSAGGGGVSTFTTGDIGDEVTNTLLTRIKPRMLAFSGTMAGISVKGKQSESDSYDAGASFTADATTRRWDGTKSARWLQINGSITDHGEIAGLFLSTQVSGSE